MYRPLPDGLTIKNSPIEGLCLFATKDIKKNSFIGSCSVIRQDLKIGKNCFINANSFLNKNLKDNSKISWEKIK